MSTRLLMIAGAAVRLGYGAGALLAPAKMVSTRLAPDTGAMPDPRLTLRAFGGHQLVVAAGTLVAARTQAHTRPVLVLNLLIDGADVTAAALELRARRAPDRTLIGGILLSGSGLLSFAAALALSADRPRVPSRSS